MIGKEQLQKVRKAARLIGMVNGLQKSMEAMIENRDYYSQRSLDLEQALTESAPEALTKSIPIRTIQVADIMMQLEDLTEKNATSEERIHILQHGQEREKLSMQIQLDQLQSDYALLQQQAQAKQHDLEETLKSVTEENTELQKKYASIRRNYHLCTKNIAIMASKIASIQSDNNGLRLQADESRRAVMEMERKVTHLRESEKAILESFDFGGAQHKKLEAERTVPTDSDIAQSQKQDFSDSDIANIKSIPEPTGTTCWKNSQGQPDKLNKKSTLDRLLSIVRSKPGRNIVGNTDLLLHTESHDSKLQVFEDDSVDTPPQSSAQSEQESPLVTSKSVRRMDITIDGLDGSYTGPLGWNGLPHGTGTIRFKNGDTYLGELRNGKLHGKGAMYYFAKDKATVRGMFESNALV